MNRVLLINQFISPLACVFIFIFCLYLEYSRIFYYIYMYVTEKRKEKREKNIGREISCNRSNSVVKSIKYLQPTFRKEMIGNFFKNKKKKN